MCSDDYFIRDETPEDLPDYYDFVAAGKYMAGMPPEVAAKLLDWTTSVAQLLMQNDFTREEACKKIRWATHVVENRE